MNLDNALSFAYFAVEAILVGVLAYRSVWRPLPLVFAYCIWDIVSNLISLVIAHFFHAGYARYYVAQAAIDSILMFGVLVEVAWSVLRPIRPSLPRSALVVVAALILVLGAIIWPFSAFANLAHSSIELRVVLHLQRTASILRVVLFLLLAGFSQLLSLSWRDRELQVATGLGFYSLVSIAVSFVQPHLSTPAQYTLLNQLAIASFLSCLFYWVVSFAQKEAERREFTPQMENFLLAMAGSARSTRIALADSRASKKSDDR